MINSTKSIYLKETEIKPNRYATLVMVFMVIGIVFCWILNEIGIFRVGKWEMRIGSAIPLFFVLILLLIMLFKKSVLESPKTKWLVFAVNSIFTLSVNTLLTFHVTMLLLFPIFTAMLYRSKTYGIASIISSTICTITAPILGYVLNVWDIPLLEEFIMIGTGGTEVTTANVTNTISMLAIGKIVLYRVLPELTITSTCSLLMFHVIRLGVENINNQILIDKLSHRDVLTGLYNQNYFKQVVAADNPSQQVGVVFFDINDLKKANDTYGHECGDFLLRNCGLSISSVCDNDEINGFRVGGDEFVLILEHSNENIVKEKLNLFNETLEKINRENVDEFDGIKCSVASGYAVGDIKELNDLVRHADSTMYKNKESMKTAK